MSLPSEPTLKLEALNEYNKAKAAMNLDQALLEFLPPTILTYESFTDLPVLTSPFCGLSGKTTVRGEWYYVKNGELSRRILPGPEPEGARRKRRVSGLLAGIDVAAEYALIQQKKSKLSRKMRDLVIERYNYDRD